MKIALITTTINVPKVLELYAKFAPSTDPDECKFFVAIDKKTPEEAVNFLAYDVANTQCVYLGDQEKYESSALTGWNTDSRRNFALLEALKWGADLIVSVDDDMIPCNGEWVRPELFEEDYAGVQFGTPGVWFDAGAFTKPVASQRGLPAGGGMIGSYDFVFDAKIGVMQGIILGIPDTGAVTAIERKPFVYSVDDILRNGFVVHPQAYAVFNSQITAFRRELAPAFAQFYAHQGRNTDIFASMLMRRVMQELDLYTYYGMPCGFHARQPRPLFKDLEAEMFGLKHIYAFAEYLARTEIQGNHTVTENCRDLMLNCPIFSDELKEVAHAWYSDCEKVL